MSVDLVDVNISVPWGIISGFAIGHEKSPPVLLLHGIQDNANSFIDLIPLLPKGFYYVSIDLPGHGRSSCFAKGVPLEFANFVYSVKLVADYFKWQKITMIGHSLGAQVTIMFAGTYSERVEKFIMIDGLTPLVVFPEESAKHMRRVFNNFQRLENSLNSKDPPSYTYNEALTKMIANRRSLITEKAARQLLERCLIETESGYCFSMDQRLKLLLRPMFSLDQLKNFIDNVRSPGLLMIADETYYNYEVILGELYKERVESIFSKLKDFQLKQFKGNHDTHMNAPEVVAPIIIDYLLNKKNKL